MMQAKVALTDFGRASIGPQNRWEGVAKEDEDWANGRHKTRTRTQIFNFI